MILSGGYMDLFVELLIPVFTLLFWICNMKCLNGCTLVETTTEALSQNTILKSNPEQKKKWWNNSPTKQWGH